MTGSDETSADPAAFEPCWRWCEQIRRAVAEAIVGQDDLIEQVLVAMLAGGHVLAESVPGVGHKRLLDLLARATQMTFRWIQCTVDLAPSDLVGAEVVAADPTSGRPERTFVPGALFANVVLADEINLAPPRTQAALIEAMEHGEVRLADRSHALPQPFFVLAGENRLEPNRLEHEAGHPLRQAQRDQFLLEIRFDYPGAAQEWEIARRATEDVEKRPAPVRSVDEVRAIQQAVPRVGMSDQVLGYAWALVRSTRPASEEAPKFVEHWMDWGAGPRGLIALVCSAKARALLDGRDHATVDDVEVLARPVLRHRIAGNDAALAANLTNDRLIDMLLEAVPPDRPYRPPREPPLPDR
jgi:MoxR-like ATPase